MAVDYYNARPESIHLEVTDERSDTSSQVLLPTSDAALLRTLAQERHESIATLIARAIHVALYPPLFTLPPDQP